VGSRQPRKIIESKEGVECRSTCASTSTDLSQSDNGLTNTGRSPQAAEGANRPLSDSRAFDLTAVKRDRPPED
jgi:hypothetical protein